MYRIIFCIGRLSCMSHSVLLCLFEVRAMARVVSWRQEKKCIKSKQNKMCLSIITLFHNFFKPGTVFNQVIKKKEADSCMPPVECACLISQGWARPHARCLLSTEPALPVCLFTFLSPFSNLQGRETQVLKNLRGHTAYKKL